MTTSSQFFSALQLDPHTLPDAEKAFETTQNAITKFLEHANSLTFGKEFLPFTAADCMAYLQSAKQFDFAFNRSKGSRTLYGVPHALARQSFINDLPRAVIFPVLQRKLKALGLDQMIQAFCGDKNAPKVTHFSDIGMAHTVLEVTLETRNQAIVIKKSESDHGMFYQKILGMLGYPSYYIQCFESEDGGHWEFAEKIDGDSAMRFLLNRPLSAPLFRQLAQHAAIGDVLGRGDRHLENYVVADDRLFPIDISTLFLADNAEWVSRYVAGGLYEICPVIRLINDPGLLEESLVLFFETYRETLKLMAKKRHQILDEISDFFGPDLAETLRYRDYVTAQLDTDPGIAEQRYRAGIKVMIQRHPFKVMLEQIYADSPDRVRKDDLLFMYALANTRRFAHFFLIEPGEEIGLFGKIQELGVSESRLS